MSYISGERSVWSVNGANTQALWQKHNNTFIIYYLIFYQQWLHVCLLVWGRGVSSTCRVLNVSLPQGNADTKLCFTLVLSWLIVPFRQSWVWFGRPQAPSAFHLVFFTSGGCGLTSFYPARMSTWIFFFFLWIVFYTVDHSQLAWLIIHLWTKQLSDMSP